MKALTLRQPWASLVAIGAKRIETRSWATGYRGPLLIHAGQVCDPWWKDPLLAAAIRRVCDAAGLKTDEPLPSGVALATTLLVDCVPIEHVHPDDAERLFGNYTAGRYAWLLRGTQPCARLPLRGRLGLWDCAVPWER